MSEKFKPLDFGRTLDADDALDVYEYAVLNAMARGANNDTFKVKRSLAVLGKMAKVHRHTVSDIIERPQVARYFARVERRERAVDVWLLQEPLVDGNDKGVEPRLVDGTDKACRRDRQGLSTGTTPSASICPSLPVEIDAPCFCDDGCELCSTAAEVKVETCENHGQPLPCDYCQRQEQRDQQQGRYSEAKLREMYEKNQRQNEDPKSLV